MTLIASQTSEEGLVIRIRRKRLCFGCVRLPEATSPLCRAGSVSVFGIGIGISDVRLNFLIFGHLGISVLGNLGY